MKILGIILTAILIVIVSLNVRWICNWIFDLNPSRHYFGSVSSLNSQSGDIKFIKVYTSGVIGKTFLEPPFNYAIFETREAADSGDLHYSLALKNFPSQCISILEKIDPATRILLNGRFRQPKKNEIKINYIFNITHSSIMLTPDASKESKNIALDYYDCIRTARASE